MNEYSASLLWEQAVADENWELAAQLAAVVASPAIESSVDTVLEQ